MYGIQIMLNTEKLEIVYVPLADFLTWSFPTLFVSPSRYKYFLSIYGVSDTVLGLQT